MSDRPAVIVPTHDGAARLPALLDSLRTQTIEHDVYVIDNGSTDGTAAVLARYPEVQVIRLSANAGFGRAINLAVAASIGSTLVLINDDVVCDDRFVGELSARLDPENDVVMAAGVLLDGADPGRIDSAGIVFDETLFALDYLHGRPREAARTARDPLGPTGGAAAFDRNAFDAAGRFDERFFAYLEDVDLVARLHALGGRCRLAPDAIGVHEHSATLGSGSPRKASLMGWGRGYTIAKYGMHRRPRLMARALLGELVLSAGQIAADRTGVGVTARVRGFRAGRAAWPEPLEPPVVSPLRLRHVLGERFRAARRRRRRTDVTTEPANLTQMPT